MEKGSFSPISFWRIILKFPIFIKIPKNTNGSSFVEYFDLYSPDFSFIISNKKICTPFQFDCSPSWRNSFVSKSWEIFNITPIIFPVRFLLVLQSIFYNCKLSPSSLLFSRITGKTSSFVSFFVGVARLSPENPKL